MTEQQRLKNLSVPTGAVDVVLDTDAYNEVDDQYAIAYLLRSGEKLPSVRELAAQLAINPNTIQRSYRQLEMEGWIMTVPGKGCFVCENEESRQREMQRWLDAFDEAAQALKTLGVEKEKLVERLK